MPFDFFKKIVQKVDQLFTGRGRVDEELFEELEELLLQGDVNVHTTHAVLKDLRTAVQEERMATASEVVKRLQADLLAVLEKSGDNRLKVAPSPPTLYLVVGVNGVGKTTTIAKLAHRIQKQGKRVVLAAGDTFR